ncbi:MAG: LysR family transcriptional regulator, partial [Rhodospirillales bacterium]|nr:LysR family transcriptional regulator [Rhodospirillales bacterium]
MDVLAGMRVFARVAETGGFSAVARELSTTQPTVSRTVAALESHLGVRLLLR